MQVLKFREAGSTRVRLAGQPVNATQSGSILFVVFILICVFVFDVSDVPRIIGVV